MAQWWYMFNDWYSGGTSVWMAQWWYVCVFGTAMVRYATLCYARLCHAMLCYAMPCYAMLCHAIVCCAMLCYAVPCYAMLCQHVLPWVIFRWISAVFQVFLWWFSTTRCCAMLRDDYNSYARLRYAMIWYGMCCAMLCYGRLWCRPMHVLYACTPRDF